MYVATGGSMMVAIHIVAANEGSGRIKEKHPWSFGETGICLYCTHCLVCFELMPTERHGHPWWVYSPPKKAGESCIQYFYKNTSAIPKTHNKRD